MNLHAMNGNKVPVLGGAKFANKVSDFFLFNFGSKNVNDNCMELRKSLSQRQDLKRDCIIVHTWRYHSEIKIIGTASMR